MILLIVWLSLMAACCWLIRRTARVRDFHLDLIRQVSDASQADIDAGSLDWHWRYEAYESVSFERMLFSLRRLKPENFYDDVSFLRSSSLPVQRGAS